MAPKKVDFGEFVRLQTGERERSEAKALAKPTQAGEDLERVQRKSIAKMHRRLGTLSLPRQQQQQVRGLRLERLESAGEREVS